MAGQYLSLIEIDFYDMRKIWTRELRHKELTRGAAQLIPIPQLIFYFIEQTAE